VQVHIRHAGTSPMLLNTKKLTGMPQKINAMAERAARESLATFHKDAPPTVAEST
jgi:hypothetical protein